MTATAAAYHEIRWRELGTDAWSDITRAPVTAELAIDGLDREKTYEVQVRAVSACGAKSVWVTASGDTPATAFPQLANLDVELGIVNDALADAAADAADALQRLDDIDDDGILSPVEKPAVIQEVEVITAEQAGIDSEADDYRITTEKATYDAAVTALTTYLAGLVAPVAWNDTSGDTAISRTAFRAKFKAVYDAKTALLSAITTLLRIRVDLAKGPNLACDYTFYASTGRWINEIGTTEGLSRSAAGYLHMVVTSNNNPDGGNCKFYEDRTFDVDPSDVFFVSVRASAAGSTHDGNVGIRWLDSAGAQISIGTVGTFTAGVANRLRSATLTPPSTAVSGQIAAYIVNGAVGDDFALREMWCEKSLLMKPGSGAQLGGARNQAMVTVGNVAAWWKNLDFSWTTTSTSASISSSAATLVMGDDSVPYSASGPVVVSGSPGTSKKVYIYCVDPDYSGGAKSIVATTSYEQTINGNGKVYMAALTINFPSSGTGSGSRPGQDCVHELAWVVRRGADGQPERVQARECVAGRDWILQTDGSWRLLRIANRCWSPIVRVDFDCGHSLTCSRTAPLELADGSGFVDAPEALGKAITYQHQGNASDVVAIEDLGMGWVMHFYLDDGSFPAGDDPDHLFGHHNIKNIPP